VLVGETAGTVQSELTPSNVSFQTSSPDQLVEHASPGVEQTVLAA
jgi:hypothetical protein